MKKEQESKDEENSEDLKESEEFEKENLEDEALEDEQELDAEQFVEFMQKQEVKAPVLEEVEPALPNPPVLLEQELLGVPGQEKKNKTDEFDYSTSNQNAEEPKYTNMENTEREMPSPLPSADLANLGKDNSWNSPSFIENHPVDSRVSSSSIEKYTLPNKAALEKATKKNPMKFERPEVRYKPSI